MYLKGGGDHIINGGYLLNNFYTNDYIFTKFTLKFQQISYENNND